MKLNQILKVNAVAIAAVIFSGAVMSFKVMEKKVADKQFYYNSTSTAEGAFQNVSNWVEGTSPSCLISGNRPCSMTVPDGSDLGDVISGLTNDQVLAIHPTERRP
ncbi:hypothetical protein ACM39_16445 [Chryseobacterium sp. FH2]|nr:hypothetical protein ACM39_16445 [Chryseobacterium sp. FH2]